MIAYPDTSFLCALYRQQANSADAARHFEKMTEALHVSSLLLFEFRQSVRFQEFLHEMDPRKGFGRTDGRMMLQDLQSDISGSAVVVAPVDWADVHNIAERLSAEYTGINGHRALDVLHVATALHLGAREFLTFDVSQRKLAQAESLKTLPKAF